MTANEQQERRKHRGRREHRRRRMRWLPAFVKCYWFEILAATLFSTGIFLLLERMEIKADLWKALVAVSGFLSRTASYVGNWILTVIRERQKSDLVGIALVLIAAGMVAHKLRARAIQRHAPPPLTRECPECGADLERVPKRLRHRMQELFLRIHIRRYACTKCSFRAAAWTTRREEDE